jgi:hypothetical protein
MDGRLFLKSCLFSIYSKRSQKEPKIKRSQTKFLVAKPSMSQTKSKEAKIEKFGSFNAKLATLLKHTSKTKRCLHPRGLEKPEIDSTGQSTHSAQWFQWHMLCTSLHVLLDSLYSLYMNGQAYTGACVHRCVRVKTRYFKNSK